MEGSVLSFLQAEGKVSDTGSALTESLVLLAIVLSFFIDDLPRMLPTKF
jgi:hypothetical protein